MKQEIKERIELINKGIVPAGYKKTPVGICPVEWEISEIRKFLKIMHGQSQHEVECKNGTYPILGTGGIIGNANSYLYDKPSILIGRKGTIDKPMFIDTPFWTIDTLFYSKIFDNVNIKYLFYIFKIINWLKYDDSTGVPSLSANTIENIKIIVSTNNLEQQKIAEILDCATRQVELQEQLVDKLKVQKKALMQKLLTPQPDWQEVKLGDICKITTGKLDANEMVENGKYPFFTCSKDIYKIDKYSYDMEALLMAGNGEIGDIKYYNGKFNAYQRTYILYNFTFNIKYAMQYLLLHFNQAVCKGSQKSSMPYIRVDLLNNAKILYPQNLDQIAIFLENFDKKIELQQKLLEQYKLRQKALMQLLLTGIVRVC